MSLLPHFRAPLADYEHEADSLLAAARAGDANAIWRFKWGHHDFRELPVEHFADTPPALHDARLVIAHEHAFEAWSALAAFVDTVQENGPIARFEAAAEAIVLGDVITLRAMLREHAELVSARSVRRHHATLLHYLAANGVEQERQRSPANAVEAARLLLDAGAEPDALADMYGARCTTMSMLVSSSPPAEAGVQRTLVELLLDHGAALDGPGSAWQSALLTALTFGFVDTAEVLASRGAPVNDLPAAAGLGREEVVARLLPSAGTDDRHRALALAAQLGRVAVVRMLLDAGEDPDRFNPDGLHSHATPLHQAVSGGHADVVALLLDHGARTDLRDTIYRGTPLDWAEHLRREEPAALLRRR